MGLNLEKLQQVRKQANGGATWREPFRILTTLLLSLLLPFSFLLLARLSAARYLASSTGLPDNSTSETSTLLSFFFLYNASNSTILYALVSLVSIAAFVNALKGRLTFFLSQSPPPKPVSHPRLCAAWILLCTLQVSVGLGIEGSIDAGIDGRGFGGRERSLFGRLIFFVGLHETMQFWSKRVVKAVVDDTVMGFVKEDERWIERVAMALSFGTLWWWRLRDEVDSLVVVAELKGELLVGVGVADFVGWWLYYLTVSIGIIRLLRGGIWLGIILLFSKVEGRGLNHDDLVSDRTIDDDKV